MERPGRADQRVKDAPVWLDGKEETENPVGADNKQAVEREKIRGECDPEIIPVGHDMAAVAADPEPADPSAHEPDPKGVSQFVSENIDEHWSREAEECDQPKKRA